MLHHLLDRECCWLSGAGSSSSQKCRSNYYVFGPLALFLPLLDYLRNNCWFYLLKKEKNCQTCSSMTLILFSFASTLPTSISLTLLSFWTSARRALLESFELRTVPRAEDGGLFRIKMFAIYHKTYWKRQCAVPQGRGRLFLALSLFHDR